MASRSSCLFPESNKSCITRWLTRIGVLAILVVICSASSPLHAAPRPQANDDSKGDTAGHVCGTRKVEARYSKLQPVPFEQVRIDEGFWAPRIKLLQEVTIPMLLTEEQKGRRKLDGPKKIRNFDIIAGRSKEKLFPENSPDSDIYKILEGASRSLASRRDAGLEALLDSVIEKIAAAQAPDGYLNTMFMLSEDHPSYAQYKSHRQMGSSMKWKHTIAAYGKGGGSQFYCAGHMMEAAAAHYRVTGKENFLRVATRFADHICEVFPLDRPIEYADHTQLGIGLIKLYEVTGCDRYLKMARHYVKNGKHYRPGIDLGEGETYKKLSEQRKCYGHIVRTPYIYSSATDVCRYFDEPELRVALDSLWHSLVDRKFFIHGGLGDFSPAQQHGEDFHLPPHRCDGESCANIAMGQWNHRRNLTFGDARYADIVEWEMYNGGLSGLSMDGRKFFYPNPLGQRKSRRYQRRSFNFCCPTKLTTFVGGIGRWVYARDAEALYINQYVASTTDIRHPRGGLRVIQRNDYPWQGDLSIKVEAEKPVELTLALRIPGWIYQPGPFPSPLYRYGDSDSRLDKVILEINGRKIALPAMENGYVRLHRRWKSGDEVRLVLPMPMRRMYADERAADLNGMVSVSRGPVLYSIEQPDNPGVSIFDVSLPAKAPFKVASRPELLGGVNTLKTEGRTADRQKVPLTMIPYYAWQNRGREDMVTWMVESFALLDGPPRPDAVNLGSEGKVVLSCPLLPSPVHHLDAIRDGYMPKRSNLKAVPRVTWWPQKGGTGWVDYRFDQPVETEEISVFWFHDAPRGGCKTPASWRLLYQDPEGNWKEVKTAASYTTEVNRPNRLTFKRISTKGLRLEVRMQKGFSAGLYEWQVEKYFDDQG